MVTAKVNNKEYKVDFKNNESGFINNVPFNIDMVEDGGGYHIIKDNKSYNVVVLQYDTDKNEICLLINNKKLKIKLLSETDILLKSLGIDIAKVKVIKEVKAPMPGLVLEIIANEGDDVSEGDNLIVLEAMKMENNLKSPISGKIKEIKIKKGVTVAKNETLITFA